ncbi:MAG TPA: CpsD/CapB family tyrosine-protein kinase [Nevskia sp.]|nr:CpsD/CapB family tyrosine-protein kinase [Nevskia sp.]
MESILSRQPEFTPLQGELRPLDMLELTLPENTREKQRILPPGAGGPYGAPYKMLRTQVVKRLEQLHANTLAILSPLAGAGKTLTAINLAVALAAERGRQVLLVDLDLRNPSVARQLGFTPQVGVEDCLLADRPLQDAMVAFNGYERLTILPARNRLDSSSELLAEQRTAEALGAFRSQQPNPVVIFDLPPVLEADDALLFSRHVQAGLMVAHEGLTRREDLTRSIELLRQLTIIGTVLNASRERLHTAY